MVKTFENTTYVTGLTTTSSLLNGLGWGFLGGLAGTLVMDLLLMSSLVVLRQPAGLCFSIVGDTISSFLGLFGMQVAGGLPTGVFTHYVIGPFFGVFFGVLVVWLKVLHVTSVKKCVLLAVLFIEVLSQPILLTTPLLLKLNASVILQWYGGSFVMHLIMSIILGLIVGCGLKLTPLAAHGSASRSS